MLRQQILESGRVLGEALIDFGQSGYELKGSTGAFVSNSLILLFRVLRIAGIGRRRNVPSHNLSPLKTGRALVMGKGVPEQPRAQDTRRGTPNGS